MIGGPDPSPGVFPEVVTRSTDYFISITYKKVRTVTRYFACMSPRERVTQRSISGTVLVRTKNEK